MNPQAQEFLNNLLTKSPKELKPDEIAFLRARRSYLKPSQLIEYKEVLETQTSKETERPYAKKSK